MNQIIDHMIAATKAAHKHTTRFHGKMRAIIALEEAKKCRERDHL